MSGDVTGRVLALDLGSKRIGVAVSDDARTVATPVATVFRHADRPRLHRELAELVAEVVQEQVAELLGIDPQELD